MIVYTSVSVSAPRPDAADSSEPQIAVVVWKLLKTRQRLSLTHTHTHRFSSYICCKHTREAHVESSASENSPKQISRIQREPPEQEPIGMLPQTGSQGLPQTGSQGVVERQVSMHS